MIRIANTAGPAICSTRERKRPDIGQARQALHGTVLGLKKHGIFPTMMMAACTERPVIVHCGRLRRHHPARRFSAISIFSNIFLVIR
jgi:hypothetical protein